MTAFWYQIGFSIMMAVATVCVLLLNAQLEKQKKTYCYVAMSIMDVIYVGYIGVILLRMLGIL